jgi:hypothetical protein
VAKREDDASAADHAGRQYRRKGHRLGIFLFCVSIIVFAVTVFASLDDRSGKYTFVLATSFVGIFVAYPLARLWYWFRAA